MPPLASPVPPQEDLFLHQLNNLLDSQHELYRLAHQLPWGQCVERFDLLYAERSGAARACRFAYLWACNT
jgi:hypothetical protein